MSIQDDIAAIREAVDANDDITITASYGARLLAHVDAQAKEIETIREANLKGVAVEIDALAESVACAALHKRIAKLEAALNKTQSLIGPLCNNSSSIFDSIREAWNVNAAALAGQREGVKT